MKQLLTLGFLFISLILLAQPINDDCSGLIDLGVAPACPDTDFFTNVDATASDIGFGNTPNCFNDGDVSGDVWFAFTTSDTIFDYTVTVTGLTNGMGSDPLTNPQVALYRGACMTDGLAEVACGSADPGETFIELDIEGLTPNVTYFIRINDYSATATPNWGTFQLCVDQMSPINTIEEGGSTACSGELFDSGGPDGDYSDNENNVFTICPSQLNGCINFNLEYYNIEFSDALTTDQLIFYDSDEANPSAIIAQIGGADFGQAGDDLGGGAVCFSVQASSGCLTVQFISDGAISMEGFAGAWECTTSPCEMINPMTIESGISAGQIEDVVATPQTSVTITDINCADQAYGLFDAGDNSDLGLGRGLLLTTGQLSWAMGPNNNAGDGNDGDNDQAGDSDLDYLSEQFGDGTESNDACIVELDVIPASNELSFEYVFGSEEYPEFVNQYNDIFAFLISGPGIVGDPNIGNQLNIAVLPDNNNTLVQINSVNNTVNWEYYRNNEDGQSVQYDGLTSDFLGIKKSLTARADVIPCSTYHLKLAIADRGDFVYDSGVFITEISGGTPNLAVQYNSGIDFLIEDCTSIPDQLVISLNAALEDTISYNVTISGTAELGEDYLLDIPEVITFLPGETEFSFPIIPLSDLEAEPLESIIISLENDFGCGSITFSELEIELRDELVVQILSGQDTALVCQDSSLVMEVTGASNYFWTPISVFNDPLSSMPIANPDQSQWVFVEGSVGPCVAEDSIFLQVVDPMITVEALDPTAICAGGQVSLQVTDNANHANLMWSPTIGLDDPTSPNPIASPTDTTTYIASVDIAGCIVADSILLDVAVFDFPEITPDTTICENFSVSLASIIDPDTTTTVFAWTPNLGLDSDSIAAPIATPDVTTTYQLIATSSNEACADSASVTVTVLPIDVEIQGNDTLEICLGKSIDLTAVTSIGTAEGLLWSPADSTLSDTTGLTVSVSPETSMTYFTSLTIGACEVLDSVYVQVDSIPNSIIETDPAKDPYCQGEIVTLVSETYEPVFFPDIEHLWLPGGLGYESQDTLWNMVLTTQDTFTYQRVTRNHACLDTTEITLNVVVPSPFTIEPMNPEICPGESVQLTANYMGQMGEITWEPETGLSCTDCLAPVATPFATTTYTMTVDVEGCPVSASAMVMVMPPPGLNLIGNQEICLGESIQLNGIDDGVSVYNWSSPDDPTFSSNDPLVLVSPDQTTTYTVLVETEGCTPLEESVTVTVIPDMQMELPEDFEVHADTPFEIPPNITPQGNFPASYFWNWGNNESSTDTILMQESIEETTLYVLEYTYGPDCGVLTDSITITLVDFDIPNVFSPNEDGFNDKFRVVHSGSIEVKLFNVYNRWGQLVYESRGDNNGWDGRHNGNLAPSEVYVYHIIFELGGAEFDERGDLTLLR